MKLQRNLSGKKLAQALSAYGYIVIRQTGSHIRLTTTQNGEHHITIPEHTCIRVGTLSAILGDVSQHLGLTRDDLIESLFD